MSFRDFCEIQSAMEEVCPCLSFCEVVVLDLNSHGLLSAGLLRPPRVATMSGGEWSWFVEGLTAPSSDFALNGILLVQWRRNVDAVVNGFAQLDLEIWWRIELLPWFGPSFQTLLNSADC